MLDMSNDTYFVDNNKMPLSVLEIRKAGATGEFCTCMNSQYDGDVSIAAKDSYFSEINSYIMKNMFYLKVQQDNGFGSQISDSIYDVVPENFNVLQQNIDHEKWLIQYFTEEGASQETISNLNQKLESLETGEENVIISPEVLEKSPLE